MTLRRWLTPLVVVAVLVYTSSMPLAQTPKGGGGTGRDNGDIDLVEKLLIARRDYQRSLELLRALYMKTGDAEKAKWAEEELRDYHRINHQAYRLDLELPPPTLQASTNIPDANKLLMRAKEFKDRGMGMDYIDNQRRAELLLQQLLTQYPTSNKIGEAAYLLGDLYESRAFKQYRRAAGYFERCFQWNSATLLDARLRAARIYDRTLNDRTHAAELYQDVTQHDTDKKRIDEAQKRLKELNASR
jgi:hypothetical protein